MKHATQCSKNTSIFYLVFENFPNYGMNVIVILKKFICISVVKQDVTILIMHINNFVFQNNEATKA